MFILNCKFIPRDMLSYSSVKLISEHKESEYCENSESQLQLNSVSTQHFVVSEPKLTQSCSI